MRRIILVILSLFTFAVLSLNGSSGCGSSPASGNSGTLTTNEERRMIQAAQGVLFSNPSTTTGLSALRMAPSALLVDERRDALVTGVCTNSGTVDITTSSTTSTIRLESCALRAAGDTYTGTMTVDTGVLTYFSVQHTNGSITCSILGTVTSTTGLAGRTEGVFNITNTCSDSVVTTLTTYPGSPLIYTPTSGGDDYLVEGSLLMRIGSATRQCNFTNQSLTAVSECANFALICGIADPTTVCGS